MTSQLVIFRAFFIYIFSPPPPPPTLNLIKNIPVNQLIKKIWTYYSACDIEESSIPSVTVRHNDLFVLLLKVKVPSQQLWSWRDGQFT